VARITPGRPETWRELQRAATDPKLQCTRLKVGFHSRVHGPSSRAKNSARERGTERCHFRPRCKNTQVQHRGRATRRVTVQRMRSAATVPCEKEQWGRQRRRRHSDPIMSRALHCYMYNTTETVAPLITFYYLSHHIL